MNEDGEQQAQDRGHELKTITIVVNGRERAVTGSQVSFDEVIAFAFASPPAGEGVQFTVQYARGLGNKPAGTLIEGQWVKIKERMEFDVTSTNRS